jgi:hypothetical protein
MNLAVYFPKLAEVTGRASNDPHPREHHCELRMRIGHLLPEHCDKWWEFNENSDYELITREVREAWSNYGRKWLEEHSTLEEARAYMVQHQDFGQATQMSVALGDMEAAQEYLNTTLIQSSASDRYISYFLQWAAKYGLKPTSEDAG